MFARKLASLEEKFKICLAEINLLKKPANYRFVFSAWLDFTCRTGIPMHLNQRKKNRVSPLGHSLDAKGVYSAENRHRAVTNCHRDIIF